jgi:hypothetical protein
MNKRKLSVITLSALTLIMLGITVTQAQTIQDSTICYGYTTALEPKGIGSTVFNYNEKVGYWVKIQTPPNVEYRVVWIDPSDTQFRSQAITVVPKTGENWGIVFDSINIAESTVKNKLGVWKVQLYIDHELKSESQVQIISYENLQSNIQNIQNQIADIVEEKDSLLAQNAALEVSLETLQVQYTALQAQVGTSSDYEKIQQDYDDLNDDYDALKANQGSTRTMMYAAIVVALVSVVVAVYFGAMKK